ncbi:hypothetical protein EDB83DRAFT_2530443 [Lactarius deliciosus]|nr:hypothetical protein EDB83DRAFT_2530443 [Lactarius deliciosus]
MSLSQEFLDSDLDELNLKPLTTGENINPTVFQIHNKLEEPDTKSYMTLGIHILIHNTSIDLDAPYQ